MYIDTNGTLMSRYFWAYKVNGICAKSDGKDV